MVWGLGVFMYYLIYKITNNLNGKIYIGQHMTDNLDDGYMGSGLVISRAVKKHGVKNFTKEILYFCTDWDTMNSMEEAIVNEAFVAREDTYNLKTGGSHGIPSEETRRRLSAVRKGLHCKSKYKKTKSTRIGRPHTEETRRKMSEARMGKIPWNKGRPMTEKQKKKISATKKKQWKQKQMQYK
jgi:group I intron endonuclease